MTKQKIKSRVSDSSGPVVPESSVEQIADRLAGLLPEDALQEALEGLGPQEITGPGGLLTQLAGRVIETALGAELSEHLGYPPGQAPPGGVGNVRNGSTPKTLKTELGEVAVRTPRDRRGSFDPRLVGKRQTRLAGLDERVLDMYAGGMSVRDIATHLQRLYGVQVGRDTISRVTDAVLEDIAAWRSRPLEALYPIVYFDALHVKMTEDRSVRTRACYLAVGVTCDGDREALGIWWQDAEGAKSGSPRRSRRCSPRPGFRPASSTRSPPRCATNYQAQVGGAATRACRHTARCGGLRRCAGRRRGPPGSRR